MERKDMSFGKKQEENERRLKRDVSERRVAEAVKQERMRRERGACEGLKEEGAAGGEEEQMRKIICGVNHSGFSTHSPPSSLQRSVSGK